MGKLFDALMSLSGSAGVNAAKESHFYGGGSVRAVMDGGGGRGCVMRDRVPTPGRSRWDMSRVGSKGGTSPRPGKLRCVGGRGGAGWGW